MAEVPENRHRAGELPSKRQAHYRDRCLVRKGNPMAFRIVAERENETVKMDRTSSLIAVAKARVWASEGWQVTIVVDDGNPLPDIDNLLVA